MVYLSSLSFGYAAGDRACPRADCPTDNRLPMPQQRRDFVKHFLRCLHKYPAVWSTPRHSTLRGVACFPSFTGTEAQGRRAVNDGRVGTPTSFGEGIKRLGGSPPP